MSSLKYRPDIDGMRAIAVLSVVIYHAFPLVLPGGFIGVDIFFVMSGYLISGILYRNHQQESFNFTNFYVRRIKRLFPALITMLALSLFMGYRLLLKNEFQELGKQIAAGTCFFQNFVFWKEAGYFDRAAELKPLLHLWSLAVEEQFYIFFPLLLIAVWNRTKVLIPLLVLLLVVTFILNVVMSIQESAADFFLTPYRAWEFLGGSLLAWWHYDRHHEEEVLQGRELISWVGMILLLIGIIFFHRGNPYPGWRALLPVIGTLLLIEGGRGAWINYKLLSHPALVWIGLISYPLYLFHWPVLSFMRIMQGGALDFPMTLLALGVALLLTLATYYLIERKIRWSVSIWTAPGLVLLFVVIGVMGYLCSKGVVLPRASALGFDTILQASEDNDYFAEYENSTVENYFSLHKLKSKGKKTLFIGDSHMEQCAPRILYLLRSGKTGDRGAVFLTQGGMPPIPGVSKVNKNAGGGFTLDILQRNLSSDIDRFVIAANWFSYFNKGCDFYEINKHPMLSPKGREEAFSQLASMISLLKSQGKEVYLVLDFPTNKKFDPLAMVHRSLFGNFSIREFHFYVNDFLHEKGLSPFTRKELLQKLEMIAAISGAKIINPLNDMEKNDELIWHHGLVPYYHDESHLTATFIREHASFLDQVMF
ncbi:MAG: acyltransferase family protein [Chthoniobacterales bacterium]